MYIYLCIYMYIYIYIYLYTYIYKHKKRGGGEQHNLNTKQNTVSWGTNKQTNGLPGGTNT